MEAGSLFKGPKKDARKPIALSVILLLVLSPLIVAAAYLSIHDFYNFTDVVFERRGAVADLAALLVNEKFKGIVNLGAALASHPSVYQGVKNNDWNEAIKSMEKTLPAFPYIDTVGLFDADGVLMATIPPMPEHIGKSFAYRDYYLGVRKEWRPYVSEVFKRAVEPKYNIVSIAVPIISPDRKALGFLLLTVKLDVILGWSRGVDAGPGGFVYVVDKKGQLVAHPNLKLGNDAVDYSSVVTVQKLLRGERGIETLLIPLITKSG